MGRHARDQAVRCAPHRQAQGPRCQWIRRRRWCWRRRRRRVHHQRRRSLASWRRRKEEASIVRRLFSRFQDRLLCLWSLPGLLRWCLQQAPHPRAPLRLSVPLSRSADRVFDRLCRYLARVLHESRRAEPTLQLTFSLSSSCSPSPLSHPRSLSPTTNAGETWTRVPLRRRFLSGSRSCR